MRRVAILVSALVAILATVVALVLPPIFGSVARSALDDLDTRFHLGQIAGADVVLDAAFYDWDAGWFTSTASVAVNAGFGGVRVFSAESPVLVTLRHGPMLSGIPSGLGWASLELVLDEWSVPALREFYEETGVDVAARLGLLLGLGGGATIGFEVPDFRVNAGGDFFVDFGGLEAVADVASDRVDYDVTFGGLRFEDQPAGRGEVGQFAMSARLYKDPRMPVLWLGDLSVDGAGFTMSENQQDVEVGQFRVRVGAGIARDVFDARVEGEMSDLHVSGYEGQYRLSDLVVDVGLQYGADTLARALRGVGSALDLENVLQTFSTVNALIRERLVLSVRRLSFSHEGLPASARLSVEYRGDELPSYLDIDDLARLMENPARLPINASFDVAFHQDLARGILRSLGAPRREAAELEGAIFEMARAGVLEERGGEYRARVEFADGMARLNGESLDRAIRGLGGRRSEAGAMLIALSEVLEGR